MISVTFLYQENGGIEVHAGCEVSMLLAVFSKQINRFMKNQAEQFLTDLSSSINGIYGMWASALEYGSQGVVAVIATADDEKEAQSTWRPPKKELIARHLEYDKSAKEAANNRFDLLPLPIGIPDDNPLSGHFSVSIGKIILYRSKLNLYLLVKLKKINWLAFR